MPPPDIYDPQTPSLHRKDQLVPVKQCPKSRLSEWRVFRGQEPEQNSYRSGLGYGLCNRNRANWDAGSRGPYPMD